MFTGIVECQGTLESIKRTGKGATIRVRTPVNFLKDRVQLGDSIATNGVCLTATVLGEGYYEADLSFESVNLTCFKDYSVGEKLNLELACTPQSRLGGHIMQGHVDGVGTVLQCYHEDTAETLWIEAPEELKRYIAMKGSIAVNGVSLTVNELKDRAFRLTLIPHTSSTVNLSFRPGAKVNLEVDVLARYLERLFSVQKESSAKPQGGISQKFLAENGFF